MGQQLGRESMAPQIKLLLGSFNPPCRVSIVHLSHICDVHNAFRGIFFLVE